MRDADSYWKSTVETISEKNRNILNEYLLNLKLEKKAESTILKYRSILERFLSECKVPIDQLTSDEVLKWLNAFSKGKKPKTLDLVLSTLSPFFQFCLKEEYMEKMVLKKRWRPKIPQSLPKYLNEQQVARLKVKIDKLPLRNRALVLFLLSSGCRISEVVTLTIQDVDVKKRTAIVRGKGKKIRHVHFSEACALVLKAYLKKRSGKSNEPLFLNKLGDGLGKSGIYTIIRNLGEETGLTQPIHPHVFRHTFATMMLARGADLQFIGDELGHSDLNTTRIYARIPSEDMKLKYQSIMG